MKAAGVEAFDRFDNLLQLFFARAEEKGDAPFLWTRKSGSWTATSWREAAAQVRALASALKGLGLEPGDRVVLVSENRPEWCIADLAIMAAGCVTAPGYTTNTERDHQHILSDSGARAVVVSTAKLARPLLPAVYNTSGCCHVIGMEPIDAGQSGDVRIHAWNDLIDAHRSEADGFELPILGREDVACLIYTSGTGGAPRGVMLHHGAILHNVAGAYQVIGEDFGLDEEVFLSFLPLSHAYEHTGGQFFPIGLGAQIYYAEGLEKLLSNIEEVRPTIMVVVPRLFEVIRQKMINAIEKQGGFASWLLHKTVPLGEKRLNGGLGIFDRPIDWLAEVALRPKVRARFGGRMKAMVSGGAPLNPDVGYFFEALGMTLLQGYGQTESAPIACVNRPKVGLRMDTVGPPIRNTEVRIAEDGEILIRGELVMKGYWRNESLTSQTVKDGWLHTGDIGELDQKGRLRITDRKKDIIVLDKGDNVAPQRVEGMLTLQAEIAQAMVIGDRRPHLVGLIVPDQEWTTAWCRTNGKIGGPGLKDDPDYLRALSAAVDRVNGQLSVIEKVRRFILADAPFTVENEQLTPSMKIRRHVLKQVYGERLEGLYRG